MSSKPDRNISVVIEDLLEKNANKESDHLADVRVKYILLKKVGGEYKRQYSYIADVMGALGEAAAVTLSQTDDIADEVIENSIAFCNVVLARVAGLRGLGDDDIPQIREEDDGIPEELRERVNQLAPLLGMEWKNRN